MKKVILGVLALIFAIALVIGGYVILSGSRSASLQRYAVEEGIPCPYFWQEQKDGTYRLEINTEAYPDYRWSAECYPKNVVAVGEAESDPGKVAFHILPLNEGQTYLKVYCEQTQPFVVCVFEVNMSISASEQGKITVEETQEKVYDGIAELGAGSDYPIQWWADSNGTVNLLIPEGGSANWEIIDYYSDGIAVSGPFYRQSDCGFEIRGISAGLFPLSIHDGADKVMILEIEVAEDLTAAVAGFTVDTYTVDRSEEHAALEQVVDSTVVLPPQTVVTGYFVTSKSGTVEFKLNDLEWRWQLAPGRTEEDLLDDIVDYAAEKATSKAGGRVLTAYRFADGVAVSWRDGDCAMALYGEREIELADALAVAEQIVEANHG